MKPIEATLDNGLRVILHPSSAAPVVAFQMWVGVGSTDERKGEEGIAHVFEHMLFKGTERREVGEIARDVENAGGQINAWTSHDETVFHITLASRYWDQALDILADAVQNASLDAKELKSELEVIREEIKMGEDDPDRLIVRDLFSTLFTKMPYRRPVIGYDRTVKRFTRKMVADFYKRWYVPANMVLSIAGDFDSKDMLDAVGEAFAEFGPKRRPIRAPRPPENQQKKIRVSHLLRPVSEARLAIGFPIPGLAHEDIPALDILAGVLGQGMSARLETIVRRQAGLVNSIRTMAYTPRDAGVFAVMANQPVASIEKATEVVCAELARVTTEPISQGELSTAKVMIESDSVYGEETVDGLARKGGFYTLMVDDAQFEETYLARVAAVDSADVIDVARRYLVPSSASVTMVVPDPKHRAPGGKVSWISGRKKEQKVDSQKLQAAIEKRIQAGFKAGAKTKKASKALSGRGNKTLVFNLSNGDRLLVRPDPSSKLVATRAAFMGGLRSERPADSGISALLAATMVQGADGNSAEQVAEQMDALACSISGFTGRNTHGIQGEFLARNFETGFELMGACLRRPNLDQEEIDREKILFQASIREARDNPARQAFEILHENMFGKHPYSRPLHGTEETIDGFTSAALKRKLSGLIGAGSMVISVVGGVDPEHVCDLTERHIVDGNAVGRPFKEPKIWKKPSRPQQVTKVLPKEQSHVVLGFPGATLFSEDRFAMDAMIEILGGHGGRLFEGVRERRGLAYAVTAMSFDGIEPGYVALYAGTSPGQEKAVVDAMIEEINAIRDKGPTSEELSRVKRHLVGARAISWQQASSRAAAMALDELYGNGHDAWQKYAKRLDKVSKKAVTEAANRYLDLAIPLAVCVGPDVERLELV
jgi:zinc protease